jgi:hypothetical protein
LSEATAEQGVPELWGISISMSSCKAAQQVDLITNAATAAVEARLPPGATEAQGKDFACQNCMHVQCHLHCEPTLTMLHSYRVNF